MFNDCVFMKLLSRKGFEHTFEAILHLLKSLAFSKNPAWYGAQGGAKIWVVELALKILAE
jgi:hypothetical protein